MEEDDSPKDGPLEDIDTEDETHVIDTENNTLMLDIEKAKSKDAVLIIIRGNPQGKKYVLNKDELVVGRDKIADIRVNDNNISRRHSLIKRGNDGFAIEDMGSRNGTYLNDKKLEFTTYLKKEDMIKVGTTILKYIPAGELEILYQENMNNAAYIDELTKVFNRNYITQAFDAEFKRAKALHTSFPVVIFDIDHFKNVNDSHGHDAGDYVLTELTTVIKSAGLRERDLLGRWGGEEFLLLVTNSTLEDAIEAAERVRVAVESHKFLYNKIEIPITISLGVANITAEHETYTDLYKNADKALYYSKENGRNQTAVFEKLPKEDQT